MLIIIEGADGAGKSTLVGQVVGALGAAFPHDDVEVFHRGPPRSHPLVEYEKPLFGYRPGTGRHIVCDRWHLGEWVYPEVLGRATAADDATFTHIELLLAARGAVLGYVDPGALTTYDRLRDRGDDLVTLSQLPTIVSSFRHVFARSTLPRRGTHDDGEFAVERLISQAREQEDRVSKLAHFVTYAGPPDPDVLLFGEVRHDIRHIARRVSDPESTRELGPAFGPYPSTSGHYLLSALRQVDTPQFSFGVANACDVDDPAALVTELGVSRVVSLGASAHYELDRRGVPHGSVPHPQYWRRFFNRHAAAYEQLVYRAALTGEHLLDWRPAGTWYDEQDQSRES